jgi:hypothetical protein
MGLGPASLVLLVSLPGTVPFLGGQMQRGSLARPSWSVAWKAPYTTRGGMGPWDMMGLGGFGFPVRLGTWVLVDDLQKAGVVVRDDGGGFYTLQMPGPTPTVSLPGLRSTRWGFSVYMHQ